MKNPATVAMREAATQLRYWCRELALTPDARGAFTDPVSDQGFTRDEGTRAGAGALQCPEAPRNTRSRHCAVTRSLHSDPCSPTGVKVNPRCWARSSSRVTAAGSGLSATAAPRRFQRGPGRLGEINQASAQLLVSRALVPRPPAR
jgi:hypothetical protein